METRSANTDGDRPWHLSYERYNISPTIDLPPADYSLLDMIEQSFAQYGEKTAYISDSKTLNYQQLDYLSRHVASHFQAMGLTVGDHIGVMLPNLLHYPIVAMAAIRAGLVLVSFNPHYTVRELSEQLADADIQALILLERDAPIFCQLQSVITAQLRHVIVCQRHDIKPPSLLTSWQNILPSAIKKHWILANFNLTKSTPSSPISPIPPIQGWLFSELLSPANQPYKRPTLTQQTPLLLQYTGGTTGVAKGAILTHGNLLANLLQIDNLLLSAYDEDAHSDVVLSSLPLYHVFSFTLGCLLVIYKGFQGLLIHTPSDISHIVKQMQRYPPSYILGVNPLFNALLQNKAFRRLDFSGIKAAIGGGMATSPAIAKRWHTVTGVPIVEGYGLSETSPVVAFNPLTIAEFTNKVGIPAPATDVQLLDENDLPVPIGERGEIVIKGPQVMQGYHNLPQETAQAFTAKGYLRTGDIGIIDERGFIKIVDRKKDMLVVSGFNVYPTEIETVMLEHPDVIECAAIGVPSATRGEEPKIFVVTRNPDLDAQTLIDYGKRHLTGYKRPRHVAFVEHLPKSAVGKLLRRELRQRERLE